MVEIRSCLGWESLVFIMREDQDKDRFRIKLHSLDMHSHVPRIALDRDVARAEMTMLSASYFLRQVPQVLGWVRQYPLYSWKFSELRGYSSPYHNTLLTV